MPLSKLALLSVTLVLFAQSKPALLPPGADAAKAVLEKSPRHGEYVDVVVMEGKPPMRCWIVFPEVKGKAPVVVVIPEIYGLSDWLRATTDAFAAEGFIAISPDLVSGPFGKGTEEIGSRDDVVKAIRGLKMPEVFDALDKTAAYATGLPAANGRFASAGFCWGGGVSFNYAAHNPDVGAAVVYYGSNPKDAATLEKIKAPVLGLYGGNDERVNATIPAADAAMKAAGKSYTHFEYEGAGHGFLRQQDGQNGANQKAAEQAWAETIRFLKEHLK